MLAMLLLLVACCTSPATNRAMSRAHRGQGRRRRHDRQQQEPRLEKTAESVQAQEQDGL